MITETTAAGLAVICEGATGKEDSGWLDDLCRAIHEVDPRSNVNGSCRNYSRSIDDAVSLVPRPCTYSINTAIAATVYLEATKKRWHGVAPTPALALCAAALKALAELEPAR